MLTMRTPKQTICHGRIQDVLSNHNLDATVLVVGSERSCRLVDWRRALPAARVEVFAGARPHNPIESVEDGTAKAVAIGAEFVIGIGGASAVDLAKNVAYLVGTEVWSIPTTLSGSEMTRMFGSVGRDGLKGGGGAGRLIPSVVVYDGRLMATMPASVLAGTGLNAWAHAIEAYYSQTEHWLGNLAAAHAAKYLPHLLREALGARVDVYGELCELACLSGFALNSCGMGLHHAVCHVLGGITRRPHGELNAMVLPRVIALSRLKAPGLIEGIETALSLDRPIEDTAHDLAYAGGLPDKLDDPEAEHWLKAAEDRILRAPHIGNYPVKLGSGDVRDLLKSIVEV